MIRGQGRCSAVRICNKPPESDYYADYNINPGDERTTGGLSEIAYANFEWVWGSKKKEDNISRYSDGDWPVLYAGLDEETARAEKAFWLIKTVFSKKSIAKISGHTVNCIQYGLEYDGDYGEIHIGSGYGAEIVHPTNYRSAQDIARKAIRNGVHFLIVPSARRVNGRNVNCFDRSACLLTGSAIPVDFKNTTAGLEYTCEEANGIITIDDVYAEMSRICVHPKKVH